MTWRKADRAAIPHPPEGMQLTGFRDPFIFQQGGQGSKWKLILGSGVKGAQGGTILLYHSDSASTGDPCARGSSCWRERGIHANRAGWLHDRMEGLHYAVQ